MKDVTVTDIHGRKSVYSIPDDAPEWHGSMGLFKGPPDLEKLDLPIDIEVRINNQLWARGLITENDLKKRPNEIILAIQSALKIDAQKISQLYS